MQNFALCVKLSAIRKRIEVVITGLTRNQVAEQSARGFESLRFRQRQEMPLGEKQKKRGLPRFFLFLCFWHFFRQSCAEGQFEIVTLTDARYSNAALLTNPFQNRQVLSILLITIHSYLFTCRFWKVTSNSEK